jgi:hypothetical protein
MAKKCACCKEEFDDYYVRHLFHGNLCEPCWEDNEEEDEDA